MPSGKRSDLISPRDIEVLEFIARYGVVPRSAVSTWAATARTATIARETRLRKAGLLRVHRSFEHRSLGLCTPAGLTACRRTELRVARLSAAAISHDTVVAAHAATLERGGQQLLSEREMLARERAEGERIFSASLRGGRFHRADLIRLDPSGRGEAIEIELSTKGAARLDQLLRAWRRAVLDRKIDSVSYRCSPRTLRYVEKAIERTKTAEMISAELL